MKREKMFNRHPDILGGTPVFTGTRVPVQTLIDCLEAEENLDEFLEGFPCVIYGSIEAIGLFFPYSTRTWAVTLFSANEHGSTRIGRNCFTSNCSALLLLPSMALDSGNTYRNDGVGPERLRSPSSTLLDSFADKSSVSVVESL